jgi:hypothetical protein
VRSLEPKLAAARDSGLANLAAIAAAEAAGHGLTVPQCLGYLRDNLHYHLGDREREAIRLFANRVAALTPTVPRPRPEARAAGLRSTAS